MDKAITFEEVNARAKIFNLELKPVGNDKYIFVLDKDFAEFTRKNPASLSALNTILKYMKLPYLEKEKFAACIESTAEGKFLLSVDKKAQKLGFKIEAIDVGYILIDSAKGVIVTHIIFPTIEDISDWLDKFKN